MFGETGMDMEARLYRRALHPADFVARIKRRIPQNDRSRVMLRHAVAALVLLASASVAAAAPDAVVEGVQFPAWMTRGRVKVPLNVGTQLKSDDEVSTGARARLLLRLADGSMVKLGENGRLQLADLAQHRKENLLTATLRVIEGAFRFTTEAALRARTRRDVSVQFATVTAGIRGTDIWGKNLGDREVVVLIEGHITVSRSGEPTIAMKDALTYLQAPKAGPSTVEPVPAGQLKAWAAETEIAAGEGAARKGGRWKLYLGNFQHSTDALRLYDELRGEGYPARIVPLEVDGAQRYRVRLAHLPSEQEAVALGGRLKHAFPGVEPVASME
jgi:cell division septation protein DedD